MGGKMRARDFVRETLAICALQLACKIGRVGFVLAGKNLVGAKVQVRIVHDRVMQKVVDLEVF